jgi:hypothetical protein
MAVHVILCERCGEPFAAQRSDKRTCSGRCRKALCVAARRGELAVCPSCGDFCARLDERTGWCSPCTRELAKLVAA